MLADLLDLVLPRTCAGCPAPAALLCPACATALDAPAAPTRPTPAPVGLPPVAAVAAYDGAVRSVLLAHKEHGRTALVRPLGRALARAVAVAAPAGRAGPAALAGPAGPLVLVPVPSAPSVVRARGHDHALRLAAAAAGELGTRCVSALRHTRAVADQAGRDTAARAVNLAGALAARSRLDGLHVVVVDDVVTTGATLAEAARALEAAGAQVRAAAVVAATARRPPDGGAA